MSHTRHRHVLQTIREKFPPSAPCSCEICLSYCSRPGWWIVIEAVRAIKSGLANRMMLEVSPEQTFAVVAPSFKGCEGFFAINEYASNGCTFLDKNLCQLHGTGLQPLECTFCHHTRVGLGSKCHLALESDWNTPNGQTVVVQWMKITGLWRKRHLCQINWRE